MNADKVITAVLVPQKNLQLIQVLRGIASMLVLLYHATINFSTINGQPFCFNFFKFGTAGVDIFFVLSGFIITYTSTQSLSQPGKMLPFIRRRCIRIFPAYWIIISFFLLAQIIFPSFYKTHYSFGFTQFISTWLLLPWHSMVNGVSWTLSFELFFYLLFSIAFIIPQKKLVYYLFVLYAMVIIIVPLSGYDLENGNAWLKLFGFPMNVEFLMGVTVAAIISKIPKRLGLPLIIAGSIIFIFNGILTDQGYYLVHSTFNRVIFFGIPSFLIICGVVKFELSNTINVHNVLLLLGEASYSLYLLHLPLIVAFIKIIGRFNIQSTLIVEILLFIAIVCICFVSVLFYKWIEKPVIYRLNSLNKKKLL